MSKADTIDGAHDEYSAFVSDTLGAFVLLRLLRDAAGCALGCELARDLAERCRQQKAARSHLGVVPRSRLRQFGGRQIEPASDGLKADCITLVETD